ncbi:oligosaccharide translocation protein rft1 [Phlyctema vagabunda]|uniref:Man(5)GlcNAc(2)-PP-dolichol translocation protein RFT1 n=1 Tax=Phlyctema vagabunda TaxID=108571 RepID=A0ABR4PM01_9HELO
MAANVQKDGITDAKPKTSAPVLSSSSSVQGASLLIALQFGSRALTFIVNQVLLRFLSPELLGIATQLEVYSISVLFFARESLRVALQRQTDTDKDAEETNSKRKDVSEGSRSQDDESKTRQFRSPIDGRTAAGRSQTVVNLAYVSIVLGIGFAVGLGKLYMKTVQAKDPSVLEQPYFRDSLNLYGHAAILELLAEPCFVVIQQKSKFKIRAAAEGISTVLRCVITCAAAVWGTRAGVDIGLAPFAFGQIAYAASLLTIYQVSTWRIASAGRFSLLPNPIRSSTQVSYFLSYFSRPLLSLGTSLFAQSALKHILTQGDTFLIASLASQKAQGIYALASNYGGLVARLVLQPIEESSRTYFGRLLSSIEGKPSKEKVMKANKDMHSLLRFYAILSVGILAIGPTVAPLLLSIVAGSRWTSSGAGQVLAVYCYYIPLLAINGITEAFVSSVATESEVNKQSAWMFAFSAGFIGSGYVFLRILNLGAEGLVWANTLNMIFRIIWSSIFVDSYFAQHGTRLSITSIIPQPLTIAAGVGTAAVLSQLRHTFTGGILDLIKAGATSLIFLILL